MATGLVELFWPCAECGNQLCHSAKCPARFYRARDFGGNKMRIHLVRHGETDEDKPESPKFSGPGDIALNEKGIRQAHDVAEFLKTLPIYFLFSSPIYRSSQTAQIIARKMGRNVQPKDIFRDWNIGAAAGNLVEKIAPFVTYFERNADAQIPNGEPYSNLWQRAIEGFQSLTGSEVAGDIAVVTHSRYIAVTNMIVAGMGMTQTDFSRSPKPGGAVTLEQDSDGKWTSKLSFGSWNGDTRSF